jgi:hypothetical protein
MAFFPAHVIRPFAVAGILGLAVLGWESSAWAQNQTPDPYMPYNSQYETFVYPVYPNATGYGPNQGVLEGRGGGYSGGGGNRFDDFLGTSDGFLLGDDFGPQRRRTGPGVPYYSSYRRYDRDYDRIYQPNAGVDQKYYQDRQQSHEKYLEYLRERDPAKRAQLYREYTLQNRRVSRDLATPRSGGYGRLGAGAGARDTSRAPGLDYRPRASNLSGLGTSYFNRPAGSSFLSSPAARSRGRTSPSETLRRSNQMSGNRAGAGGQAPGLDDDR